MCGDGRIREPALSAAEGSDRAQLDHHDDNDDEEVREAIAQVSISPA